MLGIAGEKLTRRVRGLMFESVLEQEVGWFDRKENGVGAICAKLSTDAANIQGVSSSKVINFTFSLIKQFEGGRLSDYGRFEFHIDAGHSHRPLFILRMAISVGSTDYRAGNPTRHLFRDEILPNGYLW